MVTHDSAVAAYADRLVQLRDGLVVTDGQPSPAALQHPRAFQGGSELMILWKFTCPRNAASTGATTLTLLSIVIGVAAVVAVTLCGKTTRQAYREMYQSLAGRTGLEIAADGPGIHADGFVRSLERLPGVQAAVPMVQQTTTAYHHGQRLGY